MRTILEAYLTYLCHGWCSLICDHNKNFSISADFESIFTGSK